MFDPLKIATGCAFTALVLASCSASTGDSRESASHAVGDIAMVNGKIYTVDADKTVAEAVVVKAGEVVYVGDSAGAEAYIGTAMPVLDLEGKLVLPGVHDSHLHPLEAGSEAVTCVLDSAIAPNQQAQTLQACAAEDTGLEWVLGWGHSLDSLLAMATNPREFLDAQIPDRPAAIMEETSHSIWVNSKALELAGINAATPNPVGGAILKDRQSGEPNGILLDAAGDLVFELAFAPNAVLDELNYQGLLASLDELAKNGITSIVDGRLYWKRGYLKAWERAEREGRLSARTILSLWAYPLEDDDSQLATLKSLYRNDPDSLLRISQIKFYSDGIIHNSTAALVEPYQQYFEEVGPYGLNYFDKARLTRYVTELELAGFDMHIHAIGDRAVRESLDAIEAAAITNGNAVADRRHRLTHVEMVKAEDIPRFEQLGVIADFQVAGDFAKPENSVWAAGQIGDRHKQMLPVRSIYDTGALVTLSSDWDVSSLSPFVGMQNVLQRGEQSLPDIDAAIRAYTVNAARLMRQEDKTGSIEVGKLGDLIVLDRDVTRIDVNEIGETQVLMTVLGGKTVYNNF